MPTLLQMVERIRRDINRGTDFDVPIKEGIQSAIDFYKSTRYWFNTKRAFTTVDPQVEFVTLPTDFIEIDALRLEEASQYDPMEEVAWDQIQERQRDPNYDGRPVWYAIQDNSLRLFPKPDRTYTYEIAYHCDLTAVSLSASDLASNAWTNDAYDMIRCHATAVVLSQYISAEDSEQRARTFMEYATAVDTRLKRRTGRSAASGRTTPTL